MTVDRQGDPAGGDRAAALAALAAPVGQPATRCPSAEDIVAWHEGNLNDSEAKQTEMHVAHCDACFALWTGLLELTGTAQVPATGPATNAAASRSWWPARPFVAVASVVAVAVTSGVMLLQLLSGPGAIDASLPGYEYRLPSSKAYRGGDQPVGELVIRLVTGDRFDLTLVPETAVEGEMTARAFLSTAGDGVTTLRAPPPKAMGKGTVRIEGDVGVDVELPMGKSTLLVAVGRRGAIPDGETLLARLRDEDTVADTGWVGWRIPLLVEERP